MTPRLSRQGGFTLLELLITILVIGLLAAILVPNLLGAQKRANDTQATVCASALGRAAAIYRVDHPNSAATPAAAQLYGEAEVDEFYGTQACTALPEGSVITGDATSDGNYRFTVKHALGINTFIMTPVGGQTVR